MPVLLLGGFFWIKGLPYPSYLDKPPVIAVMKANDPLAKAGVAVGDRITAVNGIATPTWEKLEEAFGELRAESSYRVTAAHPGTTREGEVSGKELIQADAAGDSALVVRVVSQHIR